MAKPISGRKAAVYVSQSTPVAFGAELGTWSSDRKTASFTTTFWECSQKYDVTILANGILTGGAITGDSANKVQVTAITAYQQGSSITVAASSVGSLAVATSAGNQIVYAIVIDSSGALASIAGTSGSASTTVGAAGGPPTIFDTDVVIGYVIRASTGATTIAASEISLTLYDGQERALNPSPYEIRNIKGQLVFATALPSNHTSGAKRIYVSGYTQAATLYKVAELIDWSLGVSREREDTTLQNGETTSSEPGRRSYSFSFNKYIASVSDSIFDHTNEEDHDFLIKGYVNQFDTTAYYAFHAGIDLDGSFPQSEKSKFSGTGQVTGRVEKIT